MNQFLSRVNQLLVEGVSGRLLLLRTLHLHVLSSFNIFLEIKDLINELRHREVNLKKGVEVTCVADVSQTSWGVRFS